VNLLEKDPGRSSHLEQSFLAQRRGMSILAAVFPLVFLASSVLKRTPFQHSISDYYWTLELERNLLVGILCAIAVFLILYKGYNWLEDRILDLAGACAAGVALVPTAAPGEEGGTLHACFAVTFFACIFYIVIFMSRKSLEELADPGRAALFRRAYRWCAGVMIGSIALALAGRLLLPRAHFEVLLDFGAVFWFEAIGVWSFAAFWYLKTRELDSTVSWVPFRERG